MVLIWIGALLVISGMVVTAVTTLRRGRLSEAKPPTSEAPRDTLEPTGRGRRLSLGADLPGIGLIALGAAFLLVSAVL